MTAEWVNAGYGAQLTLQLQPDPRQHVRCSRQHSREQLLLVTLSPECEYTMTVRSAEDAHALAELVTAAAVLGPAAGGLATTLWTASRWLPLEAEL